MDAEKALYRLVPRFGGLAQTDFEAKYEDEVGELASEEALGVFSATLPHYGKSTYTLYKGGLAILVAESGKYSLFYTEAYCEEHDRINAWAAFARGAWVDAVPAEEGLYPCRSRDGRLSWHELRRVGGRVVDVSSGYVAAGQTTNWAGQWWDQRVPSFPGAR